MIARNPEPRQRAGEGMRPTAPLIWGICCIDHSEHLCRVESPVRTAAIVALGDPLAAGSSDRVGDQRRRWQATGTQLTARQRYDSI
jgi:hypothetical protein